MLSTQPTPICLEPLVTYFQQLDERATVPELLRHLERMDIQLEDLARYAVFHDSTYRRNLVFECELGEVLLICWKSGQRSPIHNHAGSTCGVKVLKGIGHETLFDITPCGQVVATETRTLNEGEVCASQDADIHQVSNLQAEGDGLITLHIYSPPLRRMDRYSITGGPVDQYTPMNIEHTDGSGI